jgi:FixJ family two-component response regulator
MASRSCSCALAADDFPQPVIYMTGYTDDALLEHGLDPAGVVLLRKPVAEARLQRALRAAIRGAAGTRAPLDPDEREPSRG